ncbi:MAG TPA: phasin family protein [Caulobacteraceae bacterium]|jgi:hypothetical protein
MTPIQTIRTSPIKANELFANLAQTGPGAVKARERFFLELKRELDQLGQLEEQHLLPALRKHETTKALVTPAMANLRETRALLTELDAMSKEGDEFPSKIAQLKKLFAQHLRDEKNELLPAVQKVLSDEEAEALARGITDRKEQIEDAAQRTEELRRADLRHDREQARQQKVATDAADQRLDEAAEQMQRTVSQAAEGIRASSTAVGEGVKQGIRAAADVSQRSAERFSGIIESTQEATRNLATVAGCGSAIAQGAQAASREWISWAQTCTQTRMKNFGALMECRTPQQVVATQTRIAREELELIFGLASRISTITQSTAADAAQRVSSRA